jgi:hypothetical protein
MLTTLKIGGWVAVVAISALIFVTIYFDQCAQHATRESKSMTNRIYRETKLTGGFTVASVVSDKMPVF